MKRTLSIILAFLMIIGMLSMNAFEIEAAVESDKRIAELEGKTISILGDSISTYENVSNNTDYNTTLADGAIYYTPGKWNVYQKDTWWQQTIDALNMKLLVNNSWSGSSVLHTRRGTEGAYVDRFYGDLWEVQNRHLRRIHLRM